MTPEQFLREADAAGILRWASQAGAVPVSIHVHTATGESERAAGAGGCAACRHIARYPKGVTACRQSRASAAAIALRAGLPTPFICHAGFACLMAALTLGEARFAVTFGPYVPAEESRAIEDDYVAGLRRVAPGPIREQSPVSLKDIAALPVSVVPAVAEQALAMLREHWRRLTKPAPPPDWDADADGDGDVVPPVGGRRGRKPARVASRVVAASYNAEAIAAAAAAGHRDQARALIRAALAEASEAKRVPVAALRARALAVAASSVEAMGRAGHDTGAFWGRMAAFLDDCAQAQSPLQLTAAVLGVLITRKSKDNAVASPPDALLEAVQAYVGPRLTESVTLNATAAALGRNPTAVTHYLQRKFGMSFTEYVGRLRMDHAKELLRRTKLGIPEISRRIGIQDPSNFGKLFKKFESCTPAQYREKFGKARNSTGKK